MRILNIIEPTLFDQTGHGYSYVHSLLTANKDFSFAVRVWLDKRGGNLLSKDLCVARTFFYRPLRQVQKLWLYLRLVLRKEIIFVCTSDLWDLKLLAFYAKVFRTKARIFLHFHQFKQTDKKLAALRKLASSKYITILTPTAKLTQIFADAGFMNCKVVPCPTQGNVRHAAQNEIDSIKSNDNIRVLYAGAARSDKGFPLVIKLLRELRKQNINMPFAIQISAPNSQRYDADTALALQELETIRQDNLTLYRQTLDQQQYLALFNKSICLLLYDQKGYSDKFSGIALDAFYAGCPIITVQDTWMGDTAIKYGAGVALDNCEIAKIQAAIEKIKNNYAHYHANAKIAAVELQQLHDPRNTLEYFKL